MESKDGKNAKIVIRNQEMPEDMRKDAEEQATKAVEMYKHVRDIADHIRRFFDSKHQPTWNCIVGRYFGSKVTYESKRYIYFSIGQLSVLLWRCA
ncbi:dynein light chain cytoplasmic [Cystoisospora suis]|uniref:Dynein light chain n=1 Tax=Cystoisospora suis TaxID=483139 RepID=A0A2C6KHQ9_9APIC|nr:dynein light chain cytoplasmic [Cystoisospora suis]